MKIRYSLNVFLKKPLLPVALGPLKRLKNEEIKSAESFSFYKERGKKIVTFSHLPFPGKDTTLWKH